MKDNWKEKIRKWKKLLYPHWLIKVLLVIVSAGLLIYSMGYPDANPIVAYCSYGISAYALAVVVVEVPGIVRKLKGGLYANQYSNRYLTEPELRAKISLHLGSGINVLYAIFYFGTGVYYGSLWTGAIAIYYIVLSFMRVGLLRRDKRSLLLENQKERRLYELKSGHFCGCLMFLLNIAVTGMVVQMIWQNKHYDYPGFLIYAQAAYAFYCMTRAIMNLIKYRHMERPIRSAAKVVSMAGALTSLLAMQTAMLTQFGTGEKNFARIMNSMTGGVVCLTVFSMAVWMVHRTRKEMRELNGGLEN